jgi:uncharacterized membrane-anchored protein
MTVFLVLAWLFGVVALAAAVKAENCWQGIQFEMFRRLQNTCVVLVCITLTVALLYRIARAIWP